VLFRSALDPARFIPLHVLLEMDPATSEGIASIRGAAERLKSLGYCRGVSVEEVVERLIGVASLRSNALMVTAVEHELPQVLEIFDRLNSRGMKFRKVLLTTMRQTICAIFGAGWMSPEMRDFRESKPR